MTDSDPPVVPTPPDPPKVEEPIMGSVVHEGKEFIPFTGGKPTADWCGLESEISYWTSPNQARPVSLTAAQKLYNQRKAGLTTKFKRGSDLIHFKKAVWKHLEDTGMDTVLYVPDPVESTKMLSVITDHARFTLEQVKKGVETIRLKYDKYDAQNDATARTFIILSSILIPLGI